MIARGALAGLVLAALGASGAAADDGPGMIDDCWGGIVAGLRTIGTEFPEFRAGEVRWNLGVMQAMREATRDRMASADWADEDPQEVAAFAFSVCSSSDDVADILRELRDGSWMVAGMMWRQWRWDGSGLQ